MSQLGRIDPVTKSKETIGQIINRLQTLPIDFIQWADIVYLFSSKGEVPEVEMNNKLNRNVNTFDMRVKKSKSDEL